MEMLELPSCGVGSKVRGAATAEEGAESEMVDVEREKDEGDDEGGVIGARQLPPPSLGVFVYPPNFHQSWSYFSCQHLGLRASFS